MEILFVLYALLNPETRELLFRGETNTQIIFFAMFCVAIWEVSMRHYHADQQKKLYWKIEDLKLKEKD